MPSDAPVPDPEVDPLRAALDAARADLDAASAKVGEANAAVQAVLDSRFAALVDGRDPVEVFTDPGLLAGVAEKSWDGGRGDRRASEILDAAFAAVAVPGLTGWKRAVDDDEAVTVLPVLRLSYREDRGAVTEGPLTRLQAALLRLRPALASADGAMRVAVMDHGYHHAGVPTVVVLSADDARLEVMRHGQTAVDWAGTLLDVLARAADEWWYEGGPDGDAEDEG